ncbi:MAG: hypothetical protein M1838_005295 [Thelocarpon superellum]|nr:MAG: hypothetical protein M1838_005295 [Thelocarpon superellum]
MYTFALSLLTAASMLGSALAAPSLAPRDSSAAPSFEITVQSSNGTLNGAKLFAYAYEVIIIGTPDSVPRTETPNLAPTSFTLITSDGVKESKPSTLATHDLQWANDPTPFVFSVNGASGIEPAHVGSFGPDYIHVLPTTQGSEVVLAYDKQKTDPQASDFTACTRYGSWILTLKYDDNSQTAYDNTVCVDITLIATNVTGSF